MRLAIKDRDNWARVLVGHAANRQKYGNRDDRCCITALGTAAMCDKLQTMVQPPSLIWFSAVT